MGRETSCSVRFYCIVEKGNDFSIVQLVEGFVKDGYEAVRELFERNVETGRVSITVSLNLLENVPLSGLQRPALCLR